jgi:GntR family phosphonate transport system transcriptional regulator
MSLQDTASGVALWRQVADGIERGIASGSFAAGERLPGEMEIAETYRVNRHTVRRALATLAERGLVRAERGSGTYVEAQRIAYPLRARTRFSEIIGAGGHEPRGQLIDASDDVATRELARELALKTGAPLIRIEALRFADRTPICVSTTWLSAERPLRHPRLSQGVDQNHRGHRRRRRRCTAGPRAGAPSPCRRQHGRRYRR